MMKFILVIIGLFISTQSFAADTSIIEVRARVEDGSSTVEDTGKIVKTFTTGARQQQTVSLTANAFTNIAVPNTADAVLIDVGSVRSLKVKGVTGDVGISLDSAIPLLLPLSSESVTLGILNNNQTNQSINVYWF